MHSNVGGNSGTTLKAESHHLNPLEKRAAVSLASVFSFRMLGLFMLMPVLAVYGQQLQGYSPVWVGLAIGAYGLTQALFQIPMGMLSDRFGRKPVIIAGLIIFAVGSVIAAVADSIYWVTVGRALQGMGAIASAILALAADLSRDEQRPKVMAVIGMSIGLSFATALLLGPMIAEAFGIAGIFWLTALLACIGIGMVVTLVPTSVNKAPKGHTSAQRGQMLQLLKEPQLMRLNVGIFLLHLKLTAMFVVLPPMLIESGLSGAEHWQLYIPILMGSFVLMVPCMLFAIKMHKEKPVFIGAIMLLTASMLGLFHFNAQLISIAVCLLAYFVAFNYLEANLPSLISRQAPADKKGSAMGIYSSWQFFGAFAGGILGGYIADQHSVSYLFVVLAILGMLWLGFATGMRLPVRSQLVCLLSEVKSEQTAQRLASTLVDLPGVVEVIVVQEENHTYLKVDKKSFDLQKAKSLIHDITTC